MIGSLAWRADSNLLAAGCEDGNMTWWEMINGTQVKKIGSHGGVLALGFAPDGRLVSGGRDGHARIWDANGAQQRDWVPSGGAAVLKTLFSDDGKRVLTGAWNGEVKSWDAAEKDVPPMPMEGNPPSIETRLVTLKANAESQRAAAEQAAAALAEKEKAAAAVDTELTAGRAAMATLPERQKTAATQMEMIQANVVKLEGTISEFKKNLETAATAMAAAPPVPVTPAPAAEGAVAAEVKAALAQAAEADAAAGALARTLLEAKITALTQAVADGEKTLNEQRGALAQATQEAEKLKAELASLTLQMPEKEKAAAAMKQQAEAAKAALDVTQAQIAAGLKAVARWQAARQLKPALALRAESRALNEKLEGFREELKGLEATVTTAPAGPPAQRVAEIQQQLTTLPAEAEAKQKAAEAAWQEYLNLLPQ
jgi:hypothetical protein